MIILQVDWHESPYGVEAAPYKATKSSSPHGTDLKQLRNYRSNQLQRCQVCGRLFIKRREAVCSRECLEKVQQQAKQASAGRQ
jgi:hypothetical protein